MAFTTAFVFQVEEMMHSAVRDVIDGCLDTCSITPRNEWIQDWPSQVIPTFKLLKIIISINVSPVKDIAVLFQVSRWL
jgi:hypothetical protein